MSLRYELEVQNLSNCLGSSFRAPATAQQRRQWSTVLHCLLCCAASECAPRDLRVIRAMANLSVWQMVQVTRNSQQYLLCHLLILMVSSRRFVCIHKCLNLFFLNLFFCWLVLIGFNPYGCFVSTPTLLIPPQRLVKLISLFSSWHAFGQCLATSRDFHPKATELRCQRSLPKLPPPCADCLYGNPTSCVPRP